MIKHNECDGQIDRSEEHKILVGTLDISLLEISYDLSQLICIHQYNSLMMIAKEMQLVIISLWHAALTGAKQFPQIQNHTKDIAKQLLKMSSDCEEMHKEAINKKNMH